MASPFLKPLGSLKPHAEQPQQASREQQPSMVSPVPLMRPPVLKPAAASVMNAKPLLKPNTLLKKPADREEVPLRTQPVDIPQPAPENETSALRDDPMLSESLAALFADDPAPSDPEDDLPDAVDSSAMPEPCTVPLMDYLFSSGKRRGRRKM